MLCQWVWRGRGRAPKSEPVIYAKPSFKVSELNLASGFHEKKNQQILCAIATLHDDAVVLPYIFSHCHISNWCRYFTLDSQPIYRKHFSLGPRPCNKKEKDIRFSMILYKFILYTEFRALFHICNDYILRIPQILLMREIPNLYKN